MRSFIFLLMTINVIETRVMRWDLQEIDTEIWSENVKGRDKMENLCVDGRIILNQSYMNWMSGRRPVVVGIKINLVLP